MSFLIDSMIVIEDNENDYQKFLGMVFVNDDTKKWRYYIIGKS